VPSSCKEGNKSSASVKDEELIDGAINRFSRRNVLHEVIYKEQSS
jgi:hypothetical protein